MGSDLDSLKFLASFLLGVLAEQLQDDWGWRFSLPALVVSLLIAVVTILRMKRGHPVLRIIYLVLVVALGMALLAPGQSIPGPDLWQYSVAALIWLLLLAPALRPRRQPQLYAAFGAIPTVVGLILVAERIDSTNHLTRNTTLQTAASAPKGLLLIVICGPGSFCCSDF